jgi:hypothetical protein
MKYVITKEVEASSLQQALKKEKKAEVVDIRKKDEPELPPPPVGFKP